MKKILFLSMLVLLIMPVYATNCAVYFTGIGCPHCANADPTVFSLTSKYDFIVIEYEIYQQSENAQLIYQYNNQYNSGLGIPLIIFDENNSIAGDNPILENIESHLDKDNDCPLTLDTVSFEELNLNSLAGYPKIWANNRIFISDGSTINNEYKELLLSEDIVETLKDLPYTTIDTEKVYLSGADVEFEHAVELDGWKFQWNGDDVSEKTNEQTNSSSTKPTIEENDLSVSKIMYLAAVDAVNPCAIAVLTLMLIAIMTYNPRKKRNVLLAGLAFTSSVFIIYLFYGLILIKFFQLIQLLTSIKLWLYNILGFAAIILGILNVKDFFSYTPGGLATEMPLSWRPKLKKLISSITSPTGAFVIGAFVTIFLLPCTIGPYIVASGILSFMNIVKTLPWLLLYNAVFVFPMLIITILVYFGIAKVEDVSGWKDKNIKYLHLMAGIIMFFLGLAMILGWI